MTFWVWAIRYIKYILELQIRQTKCLFLMFQKILQMSHIRNTMEPDKACKNMHRDDQSIFDAKTTRKSMNMNKKWEKCWKDHECHILLFFSNLFLIVLYHVCHKSHDKWLKILSFIIDWKILEENWIESFKVIHNNWQFHSKCNICSTDHPFYFSFFFFLLFFFFSLFKCPKLISGCFSTSFP